MDTKLKKLYSKMTKKEARREAALLKKELKLLLKEVKLIEHCLEYLGYKVK